MRTYLDAKAMAKTLRQELAKHNANLSHSECLEVVAKQFGLSNWNVLAARLDGSEGAPEALKLPKDWITTGSVVKGVTHRIGIDPEVDGAAVISSLVSEDLDDKIAVLMQSIRADCYKGTRVRLSAELKTLSADCGTIWLRVDGYVKTAMRFDNMIGRSTDGPLSGTQDWTKRSVVLDVPEDADSIHFGFFLKGYGTTWARSFELTQVGNEIEATAIHSQYLAGPSNLDFHAAG